MKLFGLGLILILSACATSPRVLSVQSGMSRQEVIDLLGDPKDRSFQGNQERWVYDGPENSQKQIYFEDDRVVELRDLRKGQTADTSLDGDDSRVEGYCTHTNDFGRYATGGGCNLYGCWPAGGYCNGFGCTASGVCTVNGCPKPIKSFVCK